MVRVPSIDPKREKELARLRSILADLERTPAHRREDELADEREQDIKVMIAELERRRVQPL